MTEPRECQKCGQVVPDGFPIHGCKPRECRHWCPLCQITWEKDQEAFADLRAERDWANKKREHIQGVYDRTLAELAEANKRAERAEAALLKLIADNERRGLTSAALSWARNTLKIKFGGDQIVPEPREYLAPESFVAGEDVTHLFSKPQAALVGLADALRDCETKLTIANKRAERAEATLRSLRCHTVPGSPSDLMILAALDAGGEDTPSDVS